MQETVTPHDISFAVFLAAAILSNRKVAKEKPEHDPIWIALLTIMIVNFASIALHPNRGLVPIALSLAVPATCTWAIAKLHGFTAWGVWVFFVVALVSVFGLALLHPETYAWSILFVWGMLSGLAWVCLLDPERPTHGITHTSALVLAASLIADVPGVWAWASTGSWRAEGILSVLSVVILAMLPVLWKLPIFGR